jgi:hypothetical protein
MSKAKRKVYRTDLLQTCDNIWVDNQCSSQVKTRPIISTV